jgi:hypothetical protein
MKAQVRYNEKSDTFSITGLSGEAFLAIQTIVRTADRRCFNERRDDGLWCANDDFVCVLEDGEREALRKFCSESLK